MVRTGIENLIVQQPLDLYLSLAQKQGAKGHSLHEDAFARANVEDADKMRVRVRLDALVYFLIYLSPICLIWPPFNHPVPCWRLITQVGWQCKRHSAVIEHGTRKWRAVPTHRVNLH